MKQILSVALLTQALSLSIFILGGTKYHEKKKINSAVTPFKAKKIITASGWGNKFLVEKKGGNETQVCQHFVYKNTSISRIQLQYLY